MEIGFSVQWERLLENQSCAWIANVQKKELVYGESNVVRIYGIVGMYHTVSTDLLNVYEGVLLHNSRVYVLYVQGSRCFNVVKFILPISAPVSFCNPIESDGEGYDTTTIQ